MRDVGTTLAAHLAANNAFLCADLLTLVTSSATYRWTTAAQDIIVGSDTWSKSGPNIERGSIRQGEDLEVDTLDLDLKVGDTLTIGGHPVGLASAVGMFDGATLTIARLYMPTWGDASLVPVALFQGAVADTEPGATSIRLTARSPLERLNRTVPLPLQPACPYAVYSTGCGLTASPTSYTVTSGSTATVLHLSGTSTVGPPGWVTFTSGANAGVRRAIRANASGVLTLAVALPYVPAIGDGAQVTIGCDKTRAMCLGTFSNLQHFGGFADQPTLDTADTAEQTLPVVYGQRRVPGVPVFVANKHVAMIPFWTPAGWVPAGSGVAAAVEIAFCEGPIASVFKLWRDNTLTDIAHLQSTDSSGLTIETGTATQSVWSYLTSAALATTDPARAYAVPLARTCYLHTNGLALPNGNQPQIDAEVLGSVGVDTTEHVAHGSFDSGTTGWTVPGGSTATVSGGVCTLVGNMYQAITITDPGLYRCEVSITSIPAGGTVPLEVALSTGLSLDGTYLKRIYTDLGAQSADAYLPAGTVYLALAGGAGGAINTSVTGVSLRRSDADPADVLVDLLTNDVYGCGLDSALIDVETGPDGLAASSFRRYCQAMGWRVSALLGTRSQALGLASNLLQSCNSEPVLTGGGKLRILPRGDQAITAGSVTYTPPSTAVALGPDDFLVTGGGDPVTVKRRSAADCFNVCPVSYVDRNAAYKTLQTEIADVSADIYGRQCASVFDSSWISNSRHAQQLSSILAQRSTYIRNVYEFRLGPKHIALEKGDLVSPTEPKLGLSSARARIISTEEQSDGSWRVRAEEWPFGVATAVELNTQTADGVLGSGATPSTGTIYPAAQAQAETRAHELATKNWNTQTIPSGTYRAVAWSGTTLCAVGNSGVVATSIDGTTWTARTGAGTNGRGVAWNGSVFCAVGTSGTYNVQTSPNGVTWTGRTAPNGGTAIAWNGSVFVAISGSTCMTSTTGTTWTSRTIPAGTYYDVAWNGSVFCAVGTVSATSPDGITWTGHTLPTPTRGGTYARLAWSGSLFCAVGLDRESATSADGVTWDLHDMPLLALYGGAYLYPSAIAWTGSVFVVTQPTADTATPVYVSYDGATWAVHPYSMPGNASSGDRPIVWVDTFAVAVGANFAGTSLAP